MRQSQQCLSSSKDKVSRLEKVFDIIMVRPGQPSCFDRMKLGFMIGFAVGISSAGLFGTYSAVW